MTTSLLDSLTASISINYTLNTSQNVIGNTSTGNLSFSKNFDDTFRWILGTSAGQSNGLLYMYGSIAGGGTAIIDLLNIPNPQSNLNTNLSFSLIKFVSIELLANSNSSQGSSGIRIGNNTWQGWLSAGATHNIDIGGIPYLAGSDTGKVVNPTTNLLQILNLDSVNYATIRLTILGLLNSN